MEFFSLKGKSVGVVDKYGCVPILSSKQLPYKVIELYAGSLCILKGSCLIAIAIRSGVYLYNEEGVEIKNVVSIPRNYSSDFFLYSEGRKVKRIDNEIELLSCGSFYSKRNYMKKLFSNYKYKRSIHFGNERKVALTATRGWDSIFDPILGRDGSSIHKLVYKPKFISPIQALILFSIQISFSFDS
ncbi:hypothetical protein [Pseudoalteromonas rubra]|uniref:Uncharacterized protein n=1 Tax=Pseudoalteromonas rubra TaxID=43658 RepID=A0A5S3X338_9GAMM|nr:hypothetical protein [Pseudoalteromonas rubra]TMP38173.1 hypothetical protein CWB98_07595 [Pseudoalteromonas rubra]